jgi:hypothetical protein
VTFRFSPAPAPRIGGEAKVGGTLTLDAGKWGQSPTFKYRWLADGQPIAGASGTTYEPVAADVGKRITVAVTASRVGYADVTKTSAPTEAIPANDFTPETPVTPTPEAPAFVPAADTTPDSAETTSASDTANKISSATKSAKGVFSGVSKPKIKGTAKVGKTLKASVSGVSPKPKIKYQWYANGKAISGAKKASFKLKKARQGKTITVKVTLTRANYVKKTVTSKATKKVK